MSNNLEQVTNYELKRLKSYMDYLNKFERGYEAFLNDMKNKNELDEKDVKNAKEKSMSDLKIRENYQKAQELCRKLEQIKYKAQNGLNAKYDIKGYINDFKRANLTIPKSIKIEVEKETTDDKEQVISDFKKTAESSAKSNSTENGKINIQEILNKIRGLFKNKKKDNNFIYPILKGKAKKTDKKNNKTVNKFTNSSKQIFSKTLNTLIKPLQPLIETLIGENYNKIIYLLASNILGQDTAGMLDLSQNARNSKSYSIDAITLKNWNDPTISSIRDEVKKKVSEQFESYGFDIDKIPGFYFKNDSAPVQRLVQSEDFRDILLRHKFEILNCKRFSDNFTHKNWHNAIGKADFLDSSFDGQSNLHIKMLDTYDFNKDENNPLIQAGAKKMEEGVLHPFFTVHDIIIFKEELEYIGIL